MNKPVIFTIRFGVDFIIKVCTSPKNCDLIIKLESYKDTRDVYMKLRTYNIFYNVVCTSPRTFVVRT